MEASAQAFPVLFAGFDEVGEFFELDAADGGLCVEGFEVVAKVTVNVFVIVTFWKFAELPHEALAAGIVFARSTPAVAAPVSEGFGVGFERRLAYNVDGTAFAHGEMMRRVEGLGGDVAKGPGGGC